MQDVFVYGTLKRGFPNFDAGGMQNARFIGRYQSLEPFPESSAAGGLRPT